MTDEAMENKVHAALPPSEAGAWDQPIPEGQYNRLSKFQKALCLICAMTALSVLGLCGISEMIKIRDSGISEYLLKAFSESGKEGESIEDKLSGAVFGDTANAPKEQIAEYTDTFSPQIYYIPKEEIAEKIYLDSKELEKKIFNLYSFDYSKVPESMHAIIPSDLSCLDAASLKNDTSYRVDMAEVSKSSKLIEPDTATALPTVLIVHTHGTESFSDGSMCYYGEGCNTPRSDDIRKNVVAVGKVIAERLNEKGINTLHCEIMHDKESYINAYERSADTVKEYLEEYPTIRYVLDIHRDSLIRNDLSKLKPVTLYNGEACAQLMMIVGTSEKGAGEYDWMSNLVIAEAVQEELISNTTGVARQLYLRGASYNQQLCEHGLLVEIGSCGNTLDEAKCSAKVFADAFAKSVFGK